jgi:hypothetical protein
VQQEISQEEAPAAKASAAKPAAEKPENWKEAKKKLERDLRMCEKRIADTEKEMHALETRIAEINSILGQQGIPEMALVKELGEAGKGLQMLEEKWIELSEEKEKHAAAIEEMKS